MGGSSHVQRGQGFGPALSSSTAGIWEEVNPQAEQVCSRAGRTCLLSSSMWTQLDYISQTPLLQGIPCD